MKRRILPFITCTLLTLTLLYTTYYISIACAEGAIPDTVYDYAGISVRLGCDATKILKDGHSPDFSPLRTPGADFYCFYNSPRSVFAFTPPLNRGPKAMETQKLKAMVIYFSEPRPRATTTKFGSCTSMIGFSRTKTCLNYGYFGFLLNEHNMVYACYIGNIPAAEYFDDETVKSAFRDYKAYVDSCKKVTTKHIHKEGCTLL